jgi:beta-N-acetylhexosaminidase
MSKLFLLICFFSILLLPLRGQQKVSPPKSVKAPAKSVKAPVKSGKPPVKSVKTVAKPAKVQVKATTATPIGISSARSLRLAQRLEAQKSIVLLKNEGSLLPLQRLDTLRVLVVATGLDGENSISQLIGRYVRVDCTPMEPGDKPGSFRRKLKSANYNLVIWAMGDKFQGERSKDENLNRVDELSGLEARHSLTEEERAILDEFPSGTHTVYLLFGSRQFLSHWSATERANAVVVSGGADYDRMDLSAQLLFGGFPAFGKLTFDLPNFKCGEGLAVAPAGRLGYILPEEIGLDSLKLSQKMDSLVRIGLKEKAYPGCQVLLAKNGKIFYQRAYGYHTYNQAVSVKNDDLYDLASLTKILAPVPALMMLADQKKFQVNRKMSDYWTDWKGSNKEAILVSDILSHQARLRSGVILWPKTLDDRGIYKADFLVTQPMQGFDLRVSEGLYLVNSFPDTVFKAIHDSPLLKTKKYAYSDLGFVLFPKVIENLSGESYQSFLYQHIYRKLGANTLMFNPRKTEPKERIVPTEEDRAFRRELLHGYVHDETAALMGGVSGNAGLFGSSTDVAKVMQLYLQNGIYGNERYISPETLKSWTSSHPQKISNRRGYGFDKPAIRLSSQKVKERYPSGKVSEQSFGHSGYTGTFTWADPATELLFVFLSNRVFPDRDNQRINKLKLRTLLLDNLVKMAGEPVKPSK